MFETLSEKLTGTLRKVRGQGAPDGRESKPNSK